MSRIRHFLILLAASALSLAGCSKVPDSAESGVAVTEQWLGRWTGP